MFLRMKPDTAFINEMADLIADAYVKCSAKGNANWEDVAEAVLAWLNTNEEFQRRSRTSGMEAAARIVECISPPQAKLTAAVIRAVNRGELFDVT